MPDQWQLICVHKQSSRLGYKRVGCEEYDYLGGNLYFKKKKKKKAFVPMALTAQPDKLKSTAEMEALRESQHKSDHRCFIS